MPAHTHFPGFSCLDPACKAQPHHPISARNSAHPMLPNSYALSCGWYQGQQGAMTNAMPHIQLTPCLTVSLPLPAAFPFASTRQWLLANLGPFAHNLVLLLRTCTFYSGGYHSVITSSWGNGGPSLPPISEVNLSQLAYSSGCHWFRDGVWPKLSQ